MKKHQPGWGCIYSAINRANPVHAKEYIGKDKTGDPVNHRWKVHSKEAAQAEPRGYFQRAVKKAGGPEAFEWTIIWRGPIELLNKMEIYYIKKRHTFKDDPVNGGGYNLTKGGDGVSVWTKWSKQKVSKSSLFRFEDPAERKKISVAGLRRFEDPAEHEKLSVSSRRRWADPLEREKASLSNLRRFESPAERKKISDAGRRRFKDPAEHEKLSAAQIKRYEDPEEHEKLRNAQQRSFRANPDRCKNISLGVRKAYRRKKRLERKAEL